MENSNTGKQSILVHNNWDPLEEIWLGDVWPEHFYDDLEPDIRDSFRILTQWTKEDLNAIQNKLEEFNVKVLRPKIDGEKFLYTLENEDKNLLKPPICPRDTNGVVGNKLYTSHVNDPCYESLLSRYSNVVDKNDPRAPIFIGANSVKLGKDLIFDFVQQPNKDKIFKNLKNFLNFFVPEFSDYRLHYSSNGGHVDSCFMPVKPGLVLTTFYWKSYETTVPGWKCINIKDPSYITLNKKIKQNGANRQWLNFVEELPPHFNKFVYQKCKSWIGNYKETFFEVNMIMIDENNMLCFDTAKANEPVYEELDKHGVKCHIVPWRTRGFWDGGLHCITLDIRRKAVLQDYWPERGSNGLKTVTCSLFGNSTEKALDEFNNWLKTQGD